MSIEETDLQDIRLSRPDPDIHLWDMDLRLAKLEGLEERLEAIVDRLEAREERLIQAIECLEGIGERFEQLEELITRQEKLIHLLVNLYHEERIKTWELVLKQMLKDADRKNGKYQPGIRSG